MLKHARTDHAISPPIAQRWSPYGFAARDVGETDLAALFEAARWAPSAYNAQPWRFIVGRRGSETFTRIHGCLLGFNQAWTQFAPVLLLGLTDTLLPHNGERNHWAEHDLGLAAATLSLEATARGISVHQMAGIDPERVRSEFAVPDAVRPLTAIAIGYPGAAEIPEALATRDATPRERKPLSTFVFGGEWGTGVIAP